MNLAPLLSKKIYTQVRSGYVHLWVVVERLEEMLVGNLDILHPAQQIFGSGVVHSELDKFASDRHVRRAFGHVEVMRHWLFEIKALPVFAPPVLEPFRVEVTENKRQKRSA